VGFEPTMIHVIFNPSAAGMLRRVLSSRGIYEKVIELFDPLDWGPISAGVSERLSWLDSNAPLSETSWDWLQETEERIRNAITLDQKRLVWFSPACAVEQAGLYWYLDNFELEGRDSSL